MTGYSVARVVEMIESGELGIVFDLSALRSIRPLFRIWAPCLLARLESQPQPTDVSGAIAEILPRGPTLRGSTLKRRFNVCHHHIAQMIEDREWEVERPAGRGQNGSAVILRDSVVSWLAARRAGNFPCRQAGERKTANRAKTPTVQKNEPETEKPAPHPKSRLQRLATGFAGNLARQHERA